MLTRRGRQGPKPGKETRRKKRLSETKPSGTKPSFGDAATHRILHTKNPAQTGHNYAETSDGTPSLSSNASSLVVKGSYGVYTSFDFSRAGGPTGTGERAVQPHGISEAERDRVDAALHFLASHYGKQLVYVTIEAHDLDEKAARLLIRKAKSHFGELQRRAGLPRYNAEVLEGQHAVHSHIVGPLPWSYATQFQNYAYGEQLCVKRVYDIDGLQNYLLKEATPEAAYRTSIRRRKGSHVLGEGGGDRVRLSRDLSAALERKGVIQRHKRTYASRVISKPKNAPTTVSAPSEALPRETASVAEAPTQLALPLDAPIFPLGERLEAKRRELGLSQRDLARRLGVRQAHYSNSVIRHHDKLSGPVLRRALEWLTAATDVTRQSILPAKL